MHTYTTAFPLELCAAHLLSKLLCHTATVLSIPFHNVFGWTDSSMTLGCLNTSVSHLKLFVANWVSETVSKIPVQQWRHILTRDNPADFASRGMMPAEFIRNNLWWHGPEWLKLAPEY